MTLTMQLGAQSYDIILLRGALGQAGQALDLNRKVLIVTDSGVPARYAEALAQQCRAPVVVTIPAGEASKSLDRWQGLCATMLDAGLTRGDCVAAVGGGVVGDLSAFAASTYLRGIDFYNLPTTLLSQVDSSIGGKTAVDFAGVKNIIGTFYQPKKVLIDPDTLRTLDDRQLHAGLAEAIKMAATCDAALFAALERSENLAADLPHLIEGALRIKQQVVEQDPHEAGLRKVLNFGHTIGHAIESAAHGSLLHGECVALGMLPLCAAPVRERLRRVLEKYALPTQTDLCAQQWMPYLLHDKKRKADKITVITVPEIGRFEMLDFTPEEIRIAWEDMQ